MCDECLYFIVVNIWLSFCLNSLGLSLSKLIAMSILDRLSDKAAASRVLRYYGSMRASAEKHWIRRKQIPGDGESAYEEEKTFYREREDSRGWKDRRKKECENPTKSID